MMMTLKYTDILPNLIIIAIFVFVGLIKTKKLLIKFPDLTINNILKKLPHIYLLFPITLLLFFINIYLVYRPTIILDLPLWLQYNYCRLSWGGIIAIFSYLFSLASFLAIRTLHNERWKIVIAGSIFILTIQGIQLVYTRPIAPNLTHKIGDNGIIMQTSGVSCAAASAANILRKYNINKTEKEMAEIFETGAINGTSAAQIIYGMRDLNFRCNLLHIENLDITKVTPPAILFTRIGRINHAVAFIGYINGKIKIIDPLNGIIHMTNKRISKEWSGRCVEFHYLN